MFGSSNFSFKNVCTSNAAHRCRSDGRDRCRAWWTPVLLYSAAESSFVNISAMNKCIICTHTVPTLEQTQTIHVRMCWAKQSEQINENECEISECRRRNLANEIEYNRCAHVHTRAPESHSLDMPSGNSTHTASFDNISWIYTYTYTGNCLLNYVCMSEADSMDLLMRIITELVCWYFGFFHHNIFGPTLCCTAHTFHSDIRRLNEEPNGNGKKKFAEHLLERERQNVNNRHISSNNNMATEDCIQFSSFPFGRGCIYRIGISPVIVVCTKKLCTQIQMGVSSACVCVFFGLIIPAKIHGQHTECPMCIDRRVRPQQMWILKHNKAQNRLIECHELWDNNNAIGAHAPPPHVEFAWFGRSRKSCERKLRATDCVCVYSLYACHLWNGVMN